MSNTFRPVAAALQQAKRMSISSKFVVMYVVVFAVPIFVYALYSFNGTNRSIQSSYNQQSVEALDKVFESIRRNIDISETVIGTASDNTGFMDFINGDMTQDDLQLIQFKRDEYKQIENLKVLNPTIHHIKIYIDNDDIYKLPPLLNGREDFKDQVLFSQLANLQGRERFMLNRDDFSPMGAPVKVVSLFRELTNNRQHEGVIEVNMLQTDFFQDLYGNAEENNAMLLVREAGGEQRFLFNENSSFHLQRIDRFDSLTDHLEPHTDKEGGSFQFALSGESFVVNYKYMKHLDSYLYQIYSLEGITGKIREVRNDILLAVFVALLVLCLVTYLLSSLLLKKLGAVVSSMHKVQAGDLNVVIPVKGGDEIDELAGHFNHTLVKVKDLISQLLTEQLAAKEAENKALQSQINSHFVYNVLESIRMMADMEEKEEISEAIYSLGKMMRYSMKWKTQQVSLKEEVAMAGTYVTLMNIVSDVRVELETRIEDGLEPCTIPKMTLEPLVENAVVHGIEPTGRNGVVSVTAAYSGQFLVIAVEDDGVGMERERAERINRALEEDDYEPIGLTSGSGIGLLNVHKRIRLFYGKPYGIRLESEPGRYTRVEMRLPDQFNIGGW